jgi:hypothetical protein
VTAGKSVAAGLTREIFAMTNRADQFAIDADVLLEMYAVNTSNEKRFIRDFVGTVEVDGKAVQLQRESDFFAWEFADHKYYYCLSMGTKDGQWDRSDLRPLKEAFDSFPKELDPRQPLEGWVHFVAKNVDPEKLSNNNTYRFSFIDSLGSEIPIVKASAEKRDGEVTVQIRRQ